MAHHQNTSQFWDDGLKLISVCPMCDTNYNPHEAQLVGEAEDSHFLHITCQKCHHSIIALVLVSQGGISSVGLVTDLSFEDVLKFRKAEAVSVDDVLDLHTLLKDDLRFWPMIRT